MGQITTISSIILMNGKGINKPAHNTGLVSGALLQDKL
jgi:hypothetical protein